VGLDMYIIKKRKDIKDDNEWNEVCYWRKANQIHKWFVDNVQGGVDDCGEYLVTEDELDELRELCKKLRDEIILVDGTIRNGYTYEKDENGELVKKWNYEDGKLIANYGLCEELLPRQEGFFFGSCDYNEWYYDQIIDTIDQLDKALGTDFNEYDLYYCSSW
jgi:hypothetical protein